MKRVGRKVKGRIIFEAMRLYTPEESPSSTGFPVCFEAMAVDLDGTVLVVCATRCVGRKKQNGFLTGEELIFKVLPIFAENDESAVNEAAKVSEPMMIEALRKVCDLAEIPFVEERVSKKRPLYAREGVFE